MNALTFLVFLSTMERYLCIQCDYLFTTRVEDFTSTIIWEELWLIDDGLESGVVSFRVSTPVDPSMG